MFKKILLPIDLSDKHEHAVNIAADLAGQSGGEVLVLHVVEVIAGLAMEEERDFYNRLEKAAQTHLAHLGERLRKHGVTWRAVVILGNRVPEIIREAREMPADVIVLTAPRVDPEKLMAGLGSLSYKVGLFSPCPVLLVK